MKNIEAPKLVDVEATYVTEESKNALKLFYSLEQTMISIAYTNAVNHCIQISLKDPYNYDGHFSVDDFYKGKYDTEELLEQLYSQSEVFFNRYKNRFFATDEDVIEKIKEEYNKYDFAHNYKYLTYFVEFLNRKKLVKSMEE